MKIITCYDLHKKLASAWNHALSEDVKQALDGLLAELEEEAGK